ncbi:MAG: Fe-S cluster assembly protein IscX [Burkholderiales bacterium]|nr:Fe-S cluster assembly protein IscX [Burkholderiales bacterium]
MKMKWNEIQKIAEALYDKYPDINPISLSFEKMHQMICELEDFDDDPEKSNEHILEAVLMAWFDERE